MKIITIPELSADNSTAIEEHTLREPLEKEFIQEIVGSENYETLYVQFNGDLAQLIVNYEANDMNNMSVKGRVNYWATKLLLDQGVDNVTVRGNVILITEPEFFIL